MNKIENKVKNEIITIDDIIEIRDMLEYYYDDLLSLNEDDNTDGKAINDTLIIESLDEYIVSYPVNSMKDDYHILKLIKFNNQYLVRFKQYDHDDMTCSINILDITPLSSSEEIAQMIDAFSINKKLNDEICYYEAFLTIKADKKSA